MSEFERLIRPFQTGDIAPPRRVPPASGSSQHKVILQVGGGGGGGGAKVFHGSSSISVTVYNKKYPKETETDDA